MSDWPVTAERFVAYLDILGFSDLVMRENHDHIYDKLRKISGDIGLLNYLHGPVAPPGAGKLRIITFSDSIFIFTNDQSRASFFSIIFAISKIVITGLENGIAIKGSLASGEITIDTSKNLFFGTPIIDAYNLEKEVHYIGVVAHHSIDNKLKNNAEYGELIKNGLIECKTPMKSRHVVHLNVWWPLYTSMDDNANPFLLESLASAKSLITDLRLGASGPPRIYIDNTLEILNIVSISHLNLCSMSPPKKENGRGSNNRD